MICLLLALLSLAVSVAVLVYSRRTIRLWRRVAEGWEARAVAAERRLQAWDL